MTDVARAFLRAAESSLTGEAMNVGSGNHYSVNRLVELLGGPVVHIPKRPGEPGLHLRGHCQDSPIALGWTPKVPFEEGVRRMLERLDDWRDAPVWDPASISKATASWFRYLDNEASC